MRTHNVTEAKAQLSRLIAQVQDGEQVIIAKAGRPVAVLTAWTTEDDQPRQFTSPWKGRVRIADDFDVLPDEVMKHFTGEA